MIGGVGPKEIDALSPLPDCTGADELPAFVGLPDFDIEAVDGAMLAGVFVLRDI
ncbi:hypothetical protein [Allohahella sp. A8]|uniref:hypothetical protein n=1 Tax=Allohahella sp. A8 TaxID=3141461 RepID=UPI003A806937